jgi:hypothetical protein
LRCFSGFFFPLKAGLLRTDIVDSLRVPKSLALRA